MKPVVATRQLLVRMIRRDHSSVVKSPKKMEAFGALSGVENTFGALTDHVVSQQHASAKEHPIYAEKTVNMS